MCRSYRKRSRLDLWRGRCRDLHRGLLVGMEGFCSFGWVVVVVVEFVIVGCRLWMTLVVVVEEEKK